MKKTKLMSRLLAIMLAFVMVFSLLPVPMSADYAQAPAYTNTYEPEYQEEEYQETEYSQDEYPETEYPEEEYLEEYLEEEYPETEYPEERYLEEKYPEYVQEEECVSDKPQDDFAFALSEEDYITVFVTFEGYNLGHGFYVEPTAVTVPVGYSAAQATIALQDQNPHLGSRPDWINYRGGIGTGFYMAGLRGFNRGFVNMPSYLIGRVDPDMNDAVEGGDLTEGHFTPFSGWMITVNNVLLPVGAGSWPINDGDVIRWQFTLYGFGADVGVGDGWGSPPLFTMQDRTDLIRTLFSPGITASAKSAALAVSINPLATAEQIAWATTLLLSGEEAPVDVASDIIITPSSSDMFRGTSRTFEAVVLSQTGEAMPDEPLVLSLASGGSDSVALHSGTTLADGLVTIHPDQAFGTMVLSATSGELFAEAVITVRGPSSIQRVIGTPATSMLIGESSDFRLSILPAGATLYGYRIEWGSADDSILSVTPNANDPLSASITAVSIGSAAITARLVCAATDEQVGQTISFSPTVRPTITGLSIATGDENRTAIQGATINLNVAAYPTGANFTGYRVERTIADTTIATLPNPGSPWNNVNATAVGAGLTTSTAQLVRISDGTPVGDPIIFNITVSPLTGLTRAEANASRTLVEGATLATPVVLAPAGGGLTGSEIIRTSTDSEIITPAAGTLLTNNATAHRAGTARIYAQLRSGGVDIGEPVYFDFTVTPVLSREGLEDVQLDIGDELVLSIVQHGSTLNASRFIQWTSSDDSVVAVEEHPAPTNAATANITLLNEITAVSNGTAIVTAQLMTGTAANRVATGTPVTFEVTVGTPTLNKSELIAAITVAEALIEANYRPASWAALQTALAAAIAVYEDANATQIEVDTTANALNDAIDGLVAFPFQVTVSPEEIFPGTQVTLRIEGNLSSIQVNGVLSYQARFSTNIPGLANIQSSSTSNLEQIRNITFTVPTSTAPGEYLLSNGRVDRSVFVAAQRPPQNSTHFQGDFPNIPITVLSSAAADKTELIAAIAAAEALTEYDYTAESWAVLQVALTAAIAIQTNTSATQDEVNAALEALTTAIEGLVLASILVPAAHLRITAPAEATVQLFRQGGFHSISLIYPQFAINLADGTQVVGFPVGGTHYRVSMEGKITRTGFTTSGDLTIVFGENEDPQTQVNQTSDNQLALRMEASTMVNINARNHLTMDVGETFPLRGFRAAWEIVSSETENQIVQPDFHVNILYGSDVVSLTPIPNQSSLFTITAEQPGTAVIEVYYDAIRNENRGVDSLFAATHPSRRSVIVITVGEDTATVDFDGWDTEFDTVYYLNTQTGGYFPLIATSAIAYVEVAHISNSTIGEWQAVAIGGGGYSIPVSAGNNIVRVTDNSGRVVYQVVRAAQITPIINGGQPVEPGRQFSIRFDGLFTPAPKMGNIYNPSLHNLAGTHGNLIAYTFNGNRTTAGAQYTFINNHTLHFQAPNVDGVFMMTNGSMPTSMWSFGSGFGTHRNLGHGGSNNGGYAPTFTRTASILPDIPIVVGNPQTADLTELKALLEEARELDLTHYRPATVVPLQQAMAGAEAVIENPEATELDVATALAALRAGINGLQPFPFRVTVTPAEIFPGTQVTVRIEGNLSAAQAQGGQYQLRFSTNIPGRGTVSSSTQSNINSDALRTITFTIPDNVSPGDYRLHNGLLHRSVTVPPRPPTQTTHFVGDFPNIYITVQSPAVVVDKAALIAAIAEAEVLVEADYTAESWVALQTALTAAIAVRDNTDATQDQINTATTALQTAIDALTHYVPADITWQTAMVRGLNKIIATLLAPQFGSEGGEWAVLALARAGHDVPLGYFETYLYHIGEYLMGLTVSSNPNETTANRIYNPATGKYEIRLSGAQSTENARLIVALTSLGVDASDFYHNGVTFDLVAKLGQRHSDSSDQMWGEGQGLNGPIWNLIALNARGWDTPYQISDRTWVGGTTASNPITLDERINWILDRQLINGGWALSHLTPNNVNTASLASDPDITAMALQALAPFRHRPEVADSIDRALTELARTQLSHGGWASFEVDNVQSPAQVIVALTALGIDPQTDSRFVMPEGNPVTAVLRFFDHATGGFIHGGLVNQMATEQAVYSLVAYWRFIEDMNELYNMSDAFTPTQTEVNRAALHAAIASAQSRMEANYTPATWDVLQAELAAAILVRDNEAATQAAVDIAVGRLNTALSALVPRANLDALNEAIAAAEARVQANYTVASWTAMQTALAVARQVRDDVNATQGAVNTATSNLNAARIALIRVDDPSPPPPPPPPPPARVSLTIYNPNPRPGDPVLFMQGGTVRQMYIDINPGETAYSILHRPEVGVLISSSGHPTLAGRYVESINGFGEFDGGPLSGWIYVVDRVVPSFSCSLYVLQDGNRLYWLYTYDLGNDLVPRFADSNPLGGISRAGLRAAIQRAEQRVQANYTGASWTSFQAALNAARVVYNNSNAAQSDINTAESNLNAAYHALVRISGGSAPGILPDDDLDDVYDLEDVYDIEDEMDEDVADPEAVLDEDMLADGEAVAEVIDDLMRQAYEDGATGITISIPVADGETSVELELIVRTIREVAAEGLDLTIRSNVATITLDTSTLAGMAHGRNDDEIVRIVAEILDTQVLPASLRHEPIGSDTVIRLVIMVGDTVVSNFDGLITVYMPYSPSISSQNHDLLTVYYVDSFGNMREMPGAMYENSNIIFTTNHSSLFFVSEWISPFADVLRDSWYLRNVRFAYTNGLMVGMAPGQFSPDTELSRAMMVTLLWRMEGEPIAAGGVDFYDVSLEAWYADAIAWASANGIVNGHGDGMFAPNDNITREQMALIFQNYMRFGGSDVFAYAFDGDFADADNISYWAMGAMMWANANGLITGHTLTMLVPDGTATRAEAAAILQRFMAIQ